MLLILCEGNWHQLPHFIVIWHSWTSVRGICECILSGGRSLSLVATSQHPASSTAAARISQLKVSGSKWHWSAVELCTLLLRPCAPSVHSPCNTGSMHCVVLCIICVLSLSPSPCALCPYSPCAPSPYCATSTPVKKHTLTFPHQVNGTECHVSFSNNVDLSPIWSGF
jgi:hypothetical protein